MWEVTGEATREVNGDVAMPPKLAITKHAQFLKRVLQAIPTHQAEFDSTRLVLAFFAISGLDLLNCLDDIGEEMKSNAIDWIYRLQVTKAGPRSGFTGSTMIPPEATNYHCGHLTMTYTALATLLILGDDLSRVDKKSIIEGIKACQNPDGSFTAMVNGCESDMRFLYCACCVSAILNDWSGMNREQAIVYILNSMSFDGAMGQGPGMESHAGSTFCATASLFLMRDLYYSLSNDQINRLRRWCIMRQDDGFNGRPGKSSDTCYSFWVIAILAFLYAEDLPDPEENTSFVLHTQNTLLGGLAKYKNSTPDPLHTYLGLAGLSLIGQNELLSLNAALNISEKAYAHLQEIHKKWEKD